MKFCYIFCFFVWGVFSYDINCYSAILTTFGYECFEHRDPAVIANNALINYDNIPAKVTLMNTMPASGSLAAGINDEVSFWVSPLLPAVAWSRNSHFFGGNLTLPEKIWMVYERSLFGITVNFSNFPIFVLVAMGVPVPAIAIAMGVPVPFLIGYLNRALAGGGYSSPMAAMVYHLCHGVLPGAFFLIPGGAGAVADLVVMHVHIDTRVSKNMKELSWNSLNLPPPPAPVGAPPYVSIKSRIDNVFMALGVPSPSSATVVSYDNLQS